jgi:surface carbohydrate biosynthesis protein
LLAALPRFAPGLYIDKSSAVTKIEWFRRSRALGHHLAVWDEEGLVYLNDHVYHSTRMHPEAFEQVDLLCAWGPHQRQTVLARYPEAEDRVVIGGNPRLDLLRREFRDYTDETVKALHARHGRMILVNTNFALYNHFKGLDAGVRTLSHYPMGERRDLIAGWNKFQKEGFERFREALPGIRARFPGHTLVIRPAPSESAETWQAASASIPGTVVTKEGNVVEWIRAADCVVQFNCTTAVEAFLLDVPTIAFRCVRSEQYETPLTIACSTEAFTKEELLSSLAALVEGGSAPRGMAGRSEAQRAVIREHLGDLADQHGPTSCERILTELQRRSLPPRPRTWRRVPLVKRAWRRVLRAVRRSDKVGVRYYREKFSGLSVPEVRAAAASFQRTTGRFAGVRILPVARDVVLVCPEKGRGGDPGLTRPVAPGR